MIISRTPFRVSFLGGGSDYPVWFKEHGGAVLATTVDKYCYLAVRPRPPFFEDKYRIVYSKEECVLSRYAINHTRVRETIKYCDIDNLEVLHWADLPAGKGLGTSASFSVGLLKALWTLQRKTHTLWSLASTAIYIDQEMVEDKVGCQDHWMAACGGFKRLQFNPDWQTIIEPIEPGRLENYIMLFDTGTKRVASDIAKDLIENAPKKHRELNRMMQMVDEGIEILKKQDYADFGKLLNEAWWYKKRLAGKITTPQLDDIYEAGMDAGAYGGKLLGAGGGGYMLFIVEPDRQRDVEEALDGLIKVPIKFEKKGSEIIYGLSSG